MRTCPVCNLKLNDYNYFFCTNCQTALPQGLFRLPKPLLLNLKLITYNVTLDKKRIEAAKKDFESSRATYDEETKKNLEYFRKYYSDSRVDTLWGTGPGILAFIANPFLFIATNNVDNDYFPSDSEREAERKAAEARAKKKPVFSEKLKKKSVER